MEHVVFYQSTQGMPAFRRVATVDDAVSFVEHLRNVEGVTEFSVYALSPVSLTMRAYYRVEVSEGDAAADAPTTPAYAGLAAPALPEAASPTNEPETAQPTPAEADAPAAESASPTETEGDVAPTEDATSQPETSTPFFDRYAIPAAYTQDESAEPAPVVATEEPVPADVPPSAEIPADLPFVAGPSATRSTPPAAFLRDEPAELPAEPPVAVDPSVVDPTVEEVVPVPPGRRSMGFFARS